MSRAQSLASEAFFDDHLFFEVHVSYFQKWISDRNLNRNEISLDSCGHV